MKVKEILKEEDDEPQFPEVHSVPGFVAAIMFHKFDPDNLMFGYGFNDRHSGNEALKDFESVIGYSGCSIARYLTLNQEMIALGTDTQSVLPSNISLFLAFEPTVEKLKMAVRKHVQNGDTDKYLQQSEIDSLLSGSDLIFRTQIQIFEVPFKNF